MILKKRYKILSAIGGGLFLTAAAAWLPVSADWMVRLGVPASVALDAAYGLFFLLAALVSYVFVTEIVRARLQTRRCDEVLETSQATQLHDKQLFHTLAQKEIQLAKRSDWPVSMIALFVQPMKNHVTADKDVSLQIRDIVLAELGEVMRKSDLAGSFTKNEYLIFLPNCPAANVEEIVRRIMKRVANKKIIVDEKITYHLVCKFGVASLESKAADLNRLKSRAFKALDRAKEEENNAIEIY